MGNGDRRHPPVRPKRDPRRRASWLGTSTGRDRCGVPHPVADQPRPPGHSRTWGRTDPSADRKSLYHPAASRKECAHVGGSASVRHDPCHQLHRATNCLTSAGANHMTIAPEAPASNRGVLLLGSPEGGTLERPQRPRESAPGTAWEISGCLVASLALILIVFSLAGTHPPFGMFVSFMLAFLPSYGVLTFLLHGSLVAKDRLAT